MSDSVSESNTNVDAVDRTAGESLNSLAARESATIGASQELATSSAVAFMDDKDDDDTDEYETVEEDESDSEEESGSSDEDGDDDDVDGGVEDDGDDSGTDSGKITDSYLH